MADDLQLANGFVRLLVFVRLDLLTTMRQHCRVRPPLMQNWPDRDPKPGRFGANLGSDPGSAAGLTPLVDDPRSAAGMTPF